MITNFKMNFASYLSLNVHTSSISPVRSPRVACVTHFSTTFEANLCCDNTKTFPRTLAISIDLSSGLPCSTVENTQLIYLKKEFCMLQHQLTQHMLYNIVAILILY